MEKSPTKPVAILVHDLGGPDAVAAKLKARPATVRMWIFRNAVPRPVWPDLIDAFPVVTLDRLKSIEAQAA